MAEQGERIEDWVLTELVKEGGSGSLWRARHATSGDLVVLKELSTFTTAVESFATDVDALSQITHPALPRLIASGGTNETIWAAFAAPAGDTLTFRLRTGRLSDREALDLFEVLASALAAGHEASVAHRNLTSRSVHLPSTGAQLHGLAMSLDRSAEPPEAMIKDVLALGVLLNEALTGKEADLSTSVAALDPGAAIHPALRELVALATQPETDGRIETIQEFQTRLADARARGAGSSIRAALRGRGRSIAVLLLLLLVTGGLVGAMGTGLLAGVLTQLDGFEQYLPQEWLQEPSTSGPSVAPSDPDDPTEEPSPDHPLQTAPVVPLTPDSPIVTPESPPPPPGVAELQDEAGDKRRPVSFHAQPEGARVFIDGVAIGVTPIRNHQMPYGRYRIRMERPDGVQIQQSVRIGKRSFSKWIWRGGKQLDGFD